MHLQHPEEQLHLYLFCLKIRNDTLMVFVFQQKVAAINLLAIVWNRFELNPFDKKSNVSLHISIDTKTI